MGYSESTATQVIRTYAVSSEDKKLLGVLVCLALSTIVLDGVSRLLINHIRSDNLIFCYSFRSQYTAVQNPIQPRE